MKRKSILLFALTVIIVASLNLVSCHSIETETGQYSDWGDVTDAELTIYVEAKAAFIENPANAGSFEYIILQSLSSNPFSVRTYAVEGDGKNYQFAFKEYYVNVFKDAGDKVGQVMAVIPADDFEDPNLRQ